jgi:hypothetical protein
VEILQKNVQILFPSELCSPTKNSQGLINPKPRLEILQGSEPRTAVSSPFCSENTKKSWKPYFLDDSHPKKKLEINSIPSG